MDLNEDILYQILSYLPIGYVNATILTFANTLNNKSKNKLRWSRLDPNKYLSEFTSDTDKLLSVMRELKVVVSGSRALDYFYPGTTVEDSDWDFYCPTDFLSIVLFIKYLNSLGVVWVTESVGKNVNSEYVENFVVLKGSITTKKKEIPINVLWNLCGASMGSSAVSQFHSSIVQCFISGYGSASFYHNITKRGISLRWGLDVRSNKARLFDTHSQASTRKYKNRGIKYISYESYYNTYLTYNGKLKEFDPSEFYPESRYLGDEYSLVIPFDRIPVYKRSYCNYRLRDTLILDRNKILDSMAEIHWTEAPYITKPNMDHEAIANILADKNVFTKHTIMECKDCLFLYCTSPQGLNLQTKEHTQILHLMMISKNTRSTIHDHKELLNRVVGFDTDEINHLLFLDSDNHSETDLTIVRRIIC